MGASPLQTMFVALRLYLKFDGGCFFRRLRKFRAGFQVVFLVAINLIAGAEPKSGPVQITRLLLWFVTGFDQPLGIRKYISMMHPFKHVIGPLNRGLPT